MAQDFVWKINPPDRREGTSRTWPIDPERLAGVSVIWPSEYEWQPSRLWVESLRRGLTRHVHVERSRIAQPYPGIVLDSGQESQRHPGSCTRLFRLSLKLIRPVQLVVRCTSKCNFPCSREVPARVLPEDLFLSGTICTAYCRTFGDWLTSANIPMMSTAALGQSLPRIYEAKLVRYLQIRIIFDGQGAFTQKVIQFLSRRSLARGFASICLQR